MSGQYKPGMVHSRVGLALTVASISVCITTSLAACIPKSKDGAVKVIGGKETEAFPSVAIIGDKIYCSGTFVSGNTMITAAHCEPADPVVGGVKAVKRILPKAYLETDDEKSIRATFKKSSSDVMVLVFERDIAPATSKLAAQGIPYEAKAQVVGFGCNAAEDKPEGFINVSGGRVKRVADVTISLADEGVYAIQEQPVAACPGDSGGPLFNTAGELAGITSVSNITLTVWADLKNPANQTVFADAVKLGATIPGVEAGNGDTAVER